MNYGYNVFFSQDEIFDMVKPTDPYRISLQDLVNRSVEYTSVISASKLIFSVLLHQLTFSEMFLTILLTHNASKITWCNAPENEHLTMFFCSFALFAIAATCNEFLGGVKQHLYNLSCNGTTNIMGQVASNAAIKKKYP